MGIEKTVEYENDDNTNCNWCSLCSHHRISRRNWGLGNKRTSGDHPNYCIIEIGQNTEKSLGDLRRLAVTQTPVRNHQLIMLVWKTLRREQINKVDINMKEQLERINYFARKLLDMYESVYVYVCLCVSI